MMIFVSIPTAYSATYKLGDVNNDGYINAKDSLLIRKYIAGLTSDINETAADVNGDEDITFADVLLVRRHLARLITIDRAPISDSYISEINISGIDIRNYSIVVPEEADVFTVYAAELLQDYIDDKSEIELPIVTDATPESTFEILIGATNRAESQRAAANVQLADDEYLLKKDGVKIVMLGNSYMIGGGVGKFTYDYLTYNPSLKSQICNIDDLPTSNATMSYEPLPAKSAILMIGDGMGPNHIVGTLAYNAHKVLEPDYTEFSATRLPHMCYVTTYSLTTTQSGGTTPTDSAASGTAFACGYKTFNHYIGMNAAKQPVQNIRELAVTLGKRNAIMSTELKEGATPAVFLVHHLERTELATIGVLEDAVTDCDYIKGDIEENLLSETKYALDMLSTNNDDGFFTMIEEARTDTYAHNNDRANLIHVMARFNRAIQYAMVFTVAHPDTLLVITADHETGGVTAGCGFTTKSHTTTNVQLFAIGSGAENYTGTIDNTYIPKVIAAEWGITNFGSN
jgi:hypothetical protein